ncbi:MAG: PEGA domain-containing protein [Flavobacteriaceae bacterium]|jgi:hypothetical protein|nr:PEGA domain-containing protein [Flavobacteriaceae bacterium]
MIKTITLIGCTTLLLLTTSCATIVSGSKQNLAVYSTPPHASVYINDTEVGKTPYHTKLKRKESHNVKVEKADYIPYNIELKKDFNAWYLGNIGLGGLIGFIIDPITGAMFKLTPQSNTSSTVKEQEIEVKNNEISISITMEKETK